MAPKYKFVNNKRFINPYNFVPSNYRTISRSVAPADGEKGISGYLECCLLTKTPLAIPDTSEASEDKNGHKSYPFMRINGKEYIPGSSIRGVIRSVYETITDSCYSTVLSDSHISYRTKDAFNPGLIIKRDGHYRLYRAKRYIITVVGKGYSEFHAPSGTYSIYKNQLSDFSFAQEVYIKPSSATPFIKKGHLVGNYVSDLSLSAKTGYMKGYICIGEEFSKKHFESIFVLEDGNEYFTVDQANVNDYFDVLNIYNNPSVNREIKDNPQNIYHDRLTEFEEGHYYPIWYCNENNNIYLSPAQLGRAEFNRSMGDILGSKRSCKKKNNLCAACGLFGMIGDYDNSVASRVRFSDAMLIGQVQTSNFILKELGTPHPSYIPFYAYSETGTLSYDNDTMEINGRKYYWHDPKAATDKTVYSLPNTKESISNINSTMEIIPVESRFQFKVFYDFVSENELKGLIWALTFGENSEDGNLCHKIGHGKPIGLGSVKIGIISDNRRYFESGSYEIKKQALQACDDFYPRAGEETIEALKTICSFNVCEQYEIRNPYVVGATIGEKGNIHASHQWFTTNWKLGNSKPDYYLEPIPDSLDIEDILLHPVEHVVRKEEIVRVKTMSSNNKFVQFTFSDGSNGSAFAKGKIYCNGEQLKVYRNDYNKQYKSYNCEIIG